MRKENSSFRTKFISEPGSYLQNMDYFAFIEFKDCACYCIADGIDEDATRESAKLAVSTVLTAFEENHGFSRGYLRKSIQLAHNELLREAKETRLEASITILLTDYKKIIWGYAGNSRLSYFRNGRIKYRSIDHSLSQSMAEKGEIQVDKIAYHEERHNLFCYLGQPGRFSPYISRKKKLEDGDIIILYTRGVWESIGNAELLDAVEEASNPENICTGLEDVILSQQADNIDNYTIACVFIDKVYKNPKLKKVKRYIMVLGIMVLMLSLMLGITSFMKYRKNQARIEQVLAYKSSGIEYIQQKNYTRASTEFDSACSIVEQVKAKKKSKTKMELEEIVKYERLTNYAVDAETSFEKKDYEMASNNYNNALKLAKKIKSFDKSYITYLEERNENALKYYSFIKDIQEGDDRVLIEENEEALEYYQSARDKAVDLLYTEGREQADTKIEDLKNKMLSQEITDLLAYGDQLEAEGDVEITAKKYEKAIKKYKLAIQQYDLAKAKDKSSAVAIKIDNVKLEQEEVSNKELITEAKKYASEADLAYDEEKYEAAIEAYILARDTYEKAGESEKAIAIEAKIDMAKSQPSEEQQEVEQENIEKKEKAEAYILTASDHQADDNYESAITYYNLAKEIFKELEMKDKATIIDSIVKKLMVKAKEKAGE